MPTLGDQQQECRIVQAIFAVQRTEESADRIHAGIR